MSTKQLYVLFLLNGEFDNLLLSGVPGVPDFFS
jgi:hypothetical protein